MLESDACEVLDVDREKEGRCLSAQCSVTWWIRRWGEAVGLLLIVALKNNQILWLAGP
ncbi:MULTISPECIES: hypothetical protein [unclassified Bartonella]|nr:MULTISPECIES: hypothetical protein [unclassified Bartonella]